MSLAGRYGHTWPGILYFDLPAGMLLLLLWFLLVQKPLVNNLPAAVADRITVVSGRDWLNYLRKHYPVVIISLIIGAFSHVLWDSFTHNNSSFTSNVSFLKTPLYLFFDDYPLYHILQHVSTGIGLAIVGTLFFCIPRTPCTRTRSRGFWLLLIILSIVIAIIRFSFLGYEIKIGHVVVILIASVMYALMITSALFYRRYH